MGGAARADVTRSSGRRPSGGLWAHSEFLKLWAGQSISEFGSQVSGLAIPWVAAVVLHVSPFEFSLVAVFGLLPFILFHTARGRVGRPPDCDAARS